MREITLTRGLVAMVDDEDYDHLMQKKWFAKPNVSRATGEVLTHYAYSGHRSRHMHREILGVQGGQHVDHVDGNGLNNTRANLRICTKAQNGQNRRPWSACGYRGVTPNKKGWSATIEANGVRYRLGTFPTPEEAAEAYNAKATELHGEFARLNHVRKLLSDGEGK